MPRAFEQRESEPAHGTEYFGLLRTTWLARCRRRVIVGVAVLSALAALFTSPAVALNPSLDISQYAHATWTLRDGFLPGYIEAMAQTRDGYLWLGTEFGLLRFDGIRLVPWKSPAGEHLPADSITGLLAARDGSLWIGTRGGLARWKDGKLSNYPEFAGHGVYALLEDGAGTVWTSAGSGDPTLRLCAIQSGHVQCYGNDGSLGKGVLSLCEGRSGNLWVGAETGLWRWKPGPPKLYPVRDSWGQIPALIEDDNGTILIAMSREIKRLLNEKPEGYPLPAAVRQLQPKSLLHDRNGGLWIGTLDQGLLHVHQGRMDRFTRDDGLSSNTVSRIFEDREGNIWVATLSGLDRFRDLAVTTVSVKQGLSNDYVHSVLATQSGDVWLGTMNGLNRWRDGMITIYRKHRAQTASRTTSASVVREVIDNGLPSDDVQSLFQDSRGRIWVSTKDGLAHFEAGRFTPVSAAVSGYTLAIVGDSLDNLWISNVNRGLLHLLRGRVVEAVPWTKFGGKHAASLALDPIRGGLWLGFAQGGVSYFKDGQVRESYTSAGGLGGGVVTNLELDRDGVLWASTEGGLSRVKNGAVATLNKNNGLPCNSVRWTIDDDAHSLWLWTACGLVQIARPELDAWAAKTDKAKRTVRVTLFDNSDGVPSHLSYTGFTPLVTKSLDGRLWFATVDGVGVIDPRQIPFNTLPPPVHIEQVTADRRTYEATSHLRLPPLIRDLQIDFTALSLVAPEKVRFEYMLEGRDQDWRDARNRRQAFYSDLPPRNYRFRVKASNNSGVWNEAGASWDFSIAPAYYQTTWFRLVIAAAFVALFWWLYRLRLRRIARQFNMRLEERVGERTRIAGELHDTLLQSFQGLMLRFQTVVELLPAHPLEAKQALEGALERADQAITEGRDAVQGLRSSTTVGNDLVEAVTAIGKELAANGVNEHGAKFRMVVEGTPRNLRLILRDEIYRIAREALWNAFKHAQARLIEAEIAYSGSMFRLRVRDDGIGIGRRVLGQGGRAGHWGLPGMRERARRVGGQLDVWSRPGAGTEVELSFPGSIAYEASRARASFWFFRKNGGRSS